MFGRRCVPPVTLHFFLRPDDWEKNEWKRWCGGCIRSKRDGVLVSLFCANPGAACGLLPSIHPPSLLVIFSGQRGSLKTTTLPTSHSDADRWLSLQACLPLTPLRTVLGAQKPVRAGVVSVLLLVRTISWALASSQDCLGKERKAGGRWKGVQIRRTKRKAPRTFSWYCGLIHDAVVPGFN